MARRNEPANPTIGDLIVKAKEMSQRLRQEAETVQQRAHHLDEKAHQVHLKADDVEKADRNEVYRLPSDPDPIT
jgi:ABC-type Fe3+-citrate transport system substrate-binding protein